MTAARQGKPDRVPHVEFDQTIVFCDKECVLSQPAFRFGQARCLNPIVDAQLLNGYGQMIAYGSFRDNQLSGDLRNTRAIQ